MQSWGSAVQEEGEDRKENVELGLCGSRRGRR